MTTKTAPTRSVRLLAAALSLSLAAVAFAQPATRPAAPAGERFVAGSLVFTLPAGWKAEPGSGMRFATLVTPGGVPVSVTRLNGDGGGVLMNINRWRGQLMLPPIDAAELAKVTTAVDAAGLKMIYVDIKSDAGRTVGAVIPTGNLTWFLKAQVKDAASLDPVAPDIRKLVETIKVEE